MRIFKRSVLLFIFLFLIWFLLTGFKTQELIAGAVVALLITVIYNSQTLAFEEFKLTPKSFVYSIIYIFIFIIELLKSNFDVASRVASPTLPINPGIVKVKTKLKSKMGRLILANSITLTPGTLTVETKDEFFYIHWINISTENIEDTSKEIISRFERYLEVIFG
ncbi:MAG: Na+/H+ antiporter subunit E [Candidatus Cloacimonetes bacterium]|nr:Na+/H+ antiporter subunit E [Candidatus Cloacimonadota bacterium]